MEQMRGDSPSTEQSRQTTVLSQYLIGPATVAMIAVGPL
jgi:hypothetical protein